MAKRGVQWIIDPIAGTMCCGLAPVGRFPASRNRFEKALALPSSKTIDGFDGCHRLNGKVAVEDRRAGFAAQRFNDPSLQNRFFEPEGETSPVLESSVILRPVADAVLRFHGKLRCGNYNLPSLFSPQPLFMQQSLFQVVYLAGCKTKWGRSSELLNGDGGETL